MSLVVLKESVCTHRAGLVLQQLQAAFALFQLLVDAQLLLLRPLVTLTKRQKL